MAKIPFDKVKVGDMLTAKAVNGMVKDGMVVGIYPNEENRVYVSVEYSGRYKWRESFDKIQYANNVH